jgi:hypothetical protein
MKQSPANQVIEIAIIEIQTLAYNLDSTYTTKLTYDLKAERDAIRSGANIISITGMGISCGYRTRIKRRQRPMGVNEGYGQGSGNRIQERPI